MSASESPNHQISAVNAANCPINIAIRPRPRVAHRPQGFTVQIPTALPLRVDQAADAGIRRKSSYVAILPAIRKGNGRFACSSQWRSQLRLAPAMHTRRTTCLRLLRPRRQRQRQRLPAIFRCAAYVRVGSCVTSIAGPNPQRFGVQDRHCRQTFERYSSKPLPQCTSNVSCGSKARITALQQHWPVHLSKRTSRSGKDTCVFGSELRKSC
jgi:hypothetical protein